MRKLSRGEMKKIMGGDELIGVIDDGSGCPSSCSLKSGNRTTLGTCSKVTTKSGLKGCVCSQKGGSGC